jgi:hypothetical protein
MAGGTAGLSSATWRVVVGGGAVGMTYTLNSFTVGTGYLNLAGVPVWPGSGTTGKVDLVMTMATGSGLSILSARSHAAAAFASGGAGQYLFTGAAAETITLTAATSVADVAATTGPFTKFVGALTTGTVTALSFHNDSVAATLPTSKAVSANKVLFTLNGDFSGITSVSGTGCTASSSTGTPATAGATTTNFFGIVGEYAYCVNTAAVVSDGIVELAPSFIINGTTSQSARSFTATVNVLVDTDFAAHVAKVATTLFTISRNGQSAYLYNIPSPDNTNSVGIIRVTNNGTIAGKIYGTLTLNNGTAYTGTLITSLGAGQTVQLNSTEIGAALAPGVVWTGTRARLFVSSETSKMRVQGTVQQALSTGYNNTNFSTVAPTTD